MRVVTMAMNKNINNNLKVPIMAVLPTVIQPILLMVQGDFVTGIIP
jgi:hypothetical protein